MSWQETPPNDGDATTLDLIQFSNMLARLLTVLLFCRDRTALVRWCKARSWVDNAMDGVEGVDLQTIGTAITYLIECTSDRRID